MEKQVKMVLAFICHSQMTWAEDFVVFMSRSRFKRMPGLVRPLERDAAVLSLTHGAML